MFELIKGVLKLSGERKKKIIASYFLSFIDSLLANFPVFAIGYALYLIIGGNLSDNTWLILLVALIIGVVVRTILKYINNILEQGMGIFTFAEQRLITGERVKRFEMGFFSDNNVGNLTSVFANDLSFIEQYGMGAMGILTSSLFSIAVSILVLIFVNPSLSIIYIIMSIISYFVLRAYYNKTIVEGQKQREATKDLAEAVIEYVSGMPVIKAFNLEGERFAKTENAFKRAKVLNIGFEKTAVPYVVAILSLTGLGTAAVVAMSAYSGSNSAELLPYMVMVIIFSMGAFAPINAIGMQVSLLNMSKAALDRYDDLSKIKAIDEVFENKKITDFDIEFKDVRFSYGEKEILKGINLKILQNKMTALVGRSGGGKTTITNLIARFWDVSSGVVTIGGIDISKISTEELYKHISMVFQKVYLFNDTIYNNIALGKEDATKDEIIEAAKKARCYDFIMELPDGFDTVVTSGGSSLSGGEKQRISIARAILKDAPIILLDEATASIDLDNERYIQEAINELVKEKTLIVIAHKLSSIKHADNIVVVDGGEISEQGSHDELIKADGLYKELWEKRTTAASWELAK